MRVTTYVFRDALDATGTSIASTPSATFANGANGWAAAQVTGAVAAGAEASCTELHYVCLESDAVTCVTGASFIVHGRGFYDAGSGQLQCRITSSEAPGGVVASATRLSDTELRY